MQKQHNKKNKYLAIAMLYATLLILVPTAQALSISFDGNHSLMSGSDCEVGAIYRFGTSNQYAGKALDVIVEIVGDDNDFATFTDPGSGTTYNCLGMLQDDPGDPELFSVIGRDGSDNGDDTEAWSNDLKFTFVEQGTQTPIVVDKLFLTLFDLDIDPGKSGTDNVMLEETASIYPIRGEGLSDTPINITGPGDIEYRYLVTGTSARDCSPDTDISCRIAVEYKNLSTFSLRLFNNKSDPTKAGRLFQLSLEKNYFDETNGLIKTGLDGSGVGGFSWLLLPTILLGTIRRKYKKTSHSYK